MWLDRLAGGPSSASGQSTPQPGSRSYSPLPRRTASTLSPYITSQRSGNSPRNSSLSLVSNDSSYSLLSRSRRPNGSALRQSAPTTNINDSLETLGRVLRCSKEAVIDEKENQPACCSSITEEDLELEVDFGGLSLKELAVAQAPDDIGSAPRQGPVVEDYQKERTTFESLHRSITACDDVLNSVEINLSSFRNDLAAVSADIESLQERSAALNRRLQNRKDVEKALGPLVEELSLSPEVIYKISTGHIDESWVRILCELDRRTSAYEKTSTGSQLSKASAELGPLLEKLTLKAVERIRDFLVAQIKALRSPLINAQIIQQQNFIRFKDLYTFLHKHHAVLAEEISRAYMNTMRWYYQTQFARYQQALAKIKTHILDKSDTLGYEDTTRMGTVLSNARAPGPPHDAFNLGRRIDLLKKSNQTALSSYLAEEDQTTHYLEVQFQNFNLALIDNATAEYTFLANFFSPALSYSQISKTFNYIFESTFEMGRTLSRTLMSDTYDALGILLCIRLNQNFAFELQRRKVPAVDNYINGTNMLLWPRLQVVMDRHCESIRQLTTNLPTKSSRSTNDAAKMSAAPHVVAQRFAQLLHGFLALSAEAGDDEPVTASLRRLRSEVEAFLTKQSLSYGGDKRRSDRFLYNNYSLILTIIGDTTGKFAVEQQKHFEKLKAMHREDA